MRRRTETTQTDGNNPDRRKQLTAAHLGGRVAAGRADLLLLVEGGTAATRAGRVGLGMPLTERSRSLRLLAQKTNKTKQNNGTQHNTTQHNQATQPR